MRKIYFIGAGTPTPTANRFGTCYVLQIGDEYLMFDCGPAATHKLLKIGLHPNQIEHLFFTHHHFDHNVDYPCFLLCRWDQSIGKEKELRIWGPHKTREFTERLIGPQGAFTQDWKARVGHPGSQEVFVGRGGLLPRSEPDFKVCEIDAGCKIVTRYSSVIACRVNHIEPWMQTLAYRVDTCEGSIVISSDTGPCESLKIFCRGVDTLLMHCWDHQEKMKADLSNMINGTIASAEVARETGVKRLILSHQGPSLNAPGSKERAISDISRLFSGEIIFAEESMVLSL